MGPLAEHTAGCLRWGSLRSLTMAIGAIAVSCQRVRAHGSTPARAIIESLLLEAVAIAFGALIGGSIALLIRGARRLYVAPKRRELAA
jgi:hypothetical protein